MQGNLKEWDKQFKEILQKKEKNGILDTSFVTIIICYHYLPSLDSICSSELKKRNEEIKEFHEKYSSEHKIRVKAEKQRDKLTDKLVSFTITLQLLTNLVLDIYRGIQRKI